MGFLPTLVLMMILSCYLAVYGDEIDVSWTQAPHHNAPIYPPVAPAPHHKGGHHHHHPKAAPPTKAPAVHPPTKTPSVHPPTKTPAVHPPTKTPAVHPPTKAPAVHPPTKAPAVHPPTKAPAVHPPTKAPAVHPPTKAPTVHPPAHPPSTYPIPSRKLVAVQGVVYCKSCKYPGAATLIGASPILGAVVKLVCNNTKYPTVVKATTDKNGYFFIMAPKTITTYGSHKCLVTLVSSPLATCNQPTNMHYGLKGAMLIPSKVPPVPSPSPAKAPISSPHPLPFDVFTVGPFAFEPSSKIPCPH